MASREVVVFLALFLVAWLARPRRSALDDFDAWVKGRLREGRRKARDDARG